MKSEAGSRRCEGRFNAECLFAAESHNIQQEIFNVQFNDQPQASIHVVNPLRRGGEWGLGSGKWGITKYATST